MPNPPHSRRLPRLPRGHPARFHRPRPGPEPARQRAASTMSGRAAIRSRPTPASRSCRPRPSRSVAQADILCVPGGIACVDIMEDDETLAWVAAIGERASWVTSVCTGSLILGAAGLLSGYRAACHWAWREHLALFGAEPVAERVVFDRNRVTGGGVTAGIDFALALTAAIRGEAHARLIQLALEYDPAPPFNSGSPERAGAEMVAFYRAADGENGAGPRRADPGGGRKADAKSLIWAMMAAMRTLLAALAALLLSGCWLGDSFYTAADARPGDPRRHLSRPQFERRSAAGAGRRHHPARRHDPDRRRARCSRRSRSASRRSTRRAGPSSPGPPRPASRGRTGNGSVYGLLQRADNGDFIYYLPALRGHGGGRPRRRRRRRGARRRAEALPLPRSRAAGKRAAPAPAGPDRSQQDHPEADPHRRWPGLIPPGGSSRLSRRAGMGRCRSGAAFSGSGRGPPSMAGRTQAFELPYHAAARVRL